MSKPKRRSTRQCCTCARASATKMRTLRERAEQGPLHDGLKLFNHSGRRISRIRLIPLVQRLFVARFIIYKSG